MNIHLSEHFTYRKLLRFTIPSMGMMIFSSIYSVVDGIFVSNFVGKTPFAAVNLIMPFLMILGTMGFMIGTGGSALVSKLMGEGHNQKANALFSMLVYLSFAFGILLALLGAVFMRPIAAWLGAEGAMLEDCVSYGRIMMLGLPLMILQNEFQSFCITAERPNLGLAITVAAGVTNIVLDALFVAVLPFGLEGAAAATVISQFVGGLIPVIYFFRPNQSVLRLTRPCFDGKALIQTCANGSSELVSNLSLSLVSMLYNFQLMEFAGEDGVAAYGVIMYVNYIFVGIFLGYSFGSAPVVSYHYGAENYGELQNLRRKSLRLILVMSLALTLLAELLAKPLAGIFVSYDQTLLDMTVRGFMIYSIAFLFMGFNMFASSFFTALNDGFISALISFTRAFLFQIGAVLLLPALWGLDGVWLAVVAAELLALAVSVFCLVAKRKKYHY